MVKGSELKGALKAHGLRMTPQRQLILEAVASLEGHITAERVHQLVVRQFPDVNITTVYRTLETLEQLGLVSHTHFHDGVAQFHLAAEPPHQHMLCTRCGSETELDLGVLEPLAALLLERYGFEAALGHTAIVGTCARCRAGGVGGPQDPSKER
jgi:Fur family transcriptional regulator, ferric uptake regulator